MKLSIFYIVKLVRFEHLVHITVLLNFILLLILFYKYRKTLTISRFFMSFYPIIFIVGAFCQVKLRKIITKIFKKRHISLLTSYEILIIMLLFFIINIPNSLEIFVIPGSKLETKIPELAEKDVPNNCTIIANLPTS